MLKNLNLRLLSTLFVLIFSLLFSLKFIYLVNGDVINNYPYISPDGFDWYMEGVYLVQLWEGASLPVLPDLRPPLFVFVTAADYALGHQGLMLASILGFSFFCTYLFSLKIIDSIDKGAQKTSWYIAPLAIGSTIYSLNFFKPFILADNLAVALSLASVFLLVRFQIESNKKYLLVMSVAVAILACMTQTYALIPYLITCSMGMLFNYRANKNISFKYICAIFAVSFLYLLLTALWRHIMPHATTPDNFVLLKFSAKMFGFYVDTWGYYFSPLICFFIMYRRFDLNKFSTNTATFLVIVFLFSLLSFFYQWPEARFTYYLWPWLMILFFSGVRLKTIKGSYLVSILMVVLLLLVPADYWAPSWKSVQVSVFNNWIGSYFSASPIDRKINICGDDCAGKNEFLNNSDLYVNSTLKIYSKIK